MDAGVGRSNLRVPARLLVVVAMGLLAGCQAAYYSHLIRGQYDLLSRRVPIDEVIAAERTPAPLKAALATARDARRFAIRHLGLPDNGSYTQYADLGRPYALWNVMATPELSLEPVEWCYPLAGCFAYRGYYDEQRVRQAADELRAEGRDVVVAGVAAYSTLGWFDDPVLNTMIGDRPERLVALVFHELAHQRLHVRDDTAFNESFARFVEEQGLREYLARLPDGADAVLAENRRRDEFVALVMETRARLEALYGGGGGPSELRRGKAEAFARLRGDYAVLRERWGGDGRYDGWMSGPLNNASLLPFGLYHGWVPAFEALYHDAGSDWGVFYQRCEALAGEDAGRRQAALERLKERGLRL